MGLNSLAPLSPRRKECLCKLVKAQRRWTRNQLNVQKNPYDRKLFAGSCFKMILMTRMLRILLVGYVLFCFAGGVSSQINDAKKLSRDDIVVRRDRPTVYICVNRKTEKIKKEQDTDVVWLRIYNNTIWTIRFRAKEEATAKSVFSLSSGIRVAGLTNESIAFPCYEVEPNKTGAKTQGPVWGDFHNLSFLPSNTSASFSVPINYFKLGALYLQYNYEWEFVGAVANESDAPLHRVYFVVADIKDLSKHLCD
jgi:hypothetical protein